MNNCNKDTNMYVNIRAATNYNYQRGFKVKMMCALLMGS